MITAKAQRQNVLAAAYKKTTDYRIRRMIAMELYKMNHKFMHGVVYQSGYTSKAEINELMQTFVIYLYHALENYNDYGRGFLTYFANHLRGAIRDYTRNKQPMRPHTRRGEMTYKKLESLESTVIDSNGKRIYKAANHVKAKKQPDFEYNFVNKLTDPNDKTLTKRQKEALPLYYKAIRYGIPQKRIFYNGKKVSLNSYRVAMQLAKKRIREWLEDDIKILQGASNQASQPLH